ncbi:MAG: hypothetical protein FWC73_09060 [Defluviitaleaceae bacterium]|nr:hypothetical protein [Defluviitaleaceae bacterium]
MNHLGNMEAIVRHIGYLKLSRILYQEESNKWQDMPDEEKTLRMNIVVEEDNFQGKTPCKAINKIRDYLRGLGRIIKNIRRNERETSGQFGSCNEPHQGNRLEHNSVSP